MKLFENSSFDFLQLEFGDLKLTVSKGGYKPASSAAQEAERQVAAERPRPAAPRASEPSVLPPKEVQRRTDGVPITAPMVGTFYTAPSPGAPPFVNVGDFVNEDTTVGLIEVMKVFNAVTAGVAGTITEICVQNGAFVEYGQPLFMVTPGASAAQKGSAG